MKSGFIGGVYAKKLKVEINCKTLQKKDSTLKKIFDYIMEMNFVKINQELFLFSLKFLF